MNLLEALFWMAAGAISYIYIGYPFIVFVAGRLRRRVIAKAVHEPPVTVLIAAFNEVRHIGKTLDNTLALDYDKRKLQIIVVSDGSMDGTDDVVKQYADRGVMLLRQEPRNGKTAALNRGVLHATGDLIVFADANSMFDKTALRHLVSNFADPSVGYVTGKLGYRNPDGTLTGDGCSLYMRYENFIRECETDLGSLVGVNGGIDVVRRELYVPMKADDLPDLVLPLLVVGRGFRVVYEPAALLTEEANGKPQDEYRMRVRVSLRALWTLSDMADMFDVRRHGFYSIQLLSHKALRYLAFVFMVATFLTAAILWAVSPLYQVALVLQVTVGLLACLGYWAERYGVRSRLLSAPYYFALVNVAAFLACVKFLRRERNRMWQPRLG
jgi:cellulose synthase/poly-beta-1,6-N-acetylglucosamine synthase-like glycosyltransferase